MLRTATTGTVSSTFRIEGLEDRTLFTTFPTDYQQTLQPGSGTFVYEDNLGQNIQISYNDVAFEAIGVEVTPTGGVGVGGLVPGVVGGTDPAQGANLYSIYIVASAADSFISIAPVDAKGHLHPYAGVVPNFAIINTQGKPDTTAIPAGTGSVLIGALETVEPQGTPSPQAITGVTVSAPIGLFPVPASGVLTPGITEVAVNPFTGLANNDFGNFLVGGTVTGSVAFPGNVNEFYAGTVLTGDIDGDTTVADSSTRLAPNNFAVGGDLRDFLTLGPVGNDGKFVTVQGISEPNYSTSFDLGVGGKLGEFHVGNVEQGGSGSASFAGTIEVDNSKYVSQQLAYPTSAITNIIGNNADQTEWENYETLPSAFAQNQFPDDVWAGGVTDLHNNTINDAQLLGSIPEVDSITGLPIRDASGNIIYQASVDGNIDVINSDTADFYAIPVLAGTSFQVTLTEGSLEVIDPDGRVVASNNQALATTLQVVADRPGLYRFEVTGTRPGESYNMTVTGIGEMGIGGIIVTGNMSDVGVDTSIKCSNNDIGVIDVFGVYNSLTTGPTASVNTTSAVLAPVYSPDTIFVSGGNLRALIAASLGTIIKTSTTTGKLGTSNDFTFGDGPYLDVPFGSIGLVRTTDTGGIMDLETEFDPNYLNLVSPTGISEPQFVTNDAYATAIGGNIQVIDAANVLYCNLAVDQGIGTIHAAQMDTDPASYIDVNADNTGNDGIIDLIDVPGQFGTLESGGPGIVTNNGGQIRYMLLGGTIFRDDFFGGGFETPTVYSAGQVASLTDDAGNVIVITPIGPITTTTTTIINTPSSNTTNGVSTTTASTVTTGPQISITSYAIRDKGGQVPVAITSTGSVQITSNATATGSSQVNIASVTIEGNGSQIVDTGSNDAYGNPEIMQTAPTTTAAANDGTTSGSVTNTDGSTTTTEVTIAGGGTTTQLSALFNGSAKINVLDLVSTGPTGAVLLAGDGDATLIENDTPGEIASITAPNVGQILVHGNLGYTTPVATPAAVMPRAVIAGGNTYPFVQQHTGVVIAGNIADTLTRGSVVSIDAYGGIGNVLVGPDLAHTYIVGATKDYGTIENIVPNYGVTTGVTKNPIPGQFNGIVGPIYGGIFVNVDVGQGLLPTGSGLVGFSGLFAIGSIGTVDNNGNPDGDIRGNIISGGNTGSDIAVGQIVLNNASIIDAKVYSLGFSSVSPLIVDFSRTSDLSPVLPAINNYGQLPFASPYTYEIGSISVSGKGGIIGADINAENIGPINVYNGGFGIIESNIESILLGRIASVTASGYGIRDTTIFDGGYVGPVTATGNGALVSVLNYPVDVRESDAVTIDPYFNFAPTADTDLNAALGTSAQFPNIANTTDTGVIEDDEINAQESFAGLTADKVRTAQPIFNSKNTLPTPSVANIPYIGVTFPMSIAIGGSIGYIRVANLIDGLQITAGRLGTLSLSDNVNRIGISVAGKISSMVIHGNFGQSVTDPGTGELIPDSYINAGGPSGTIGNLAIYGNLYGTVSATGEIVHMLVAGGVYGSITALSTSTPLGLGTLHVTGPINNGALTIDGNANSIIVDGGLGASAGALTIDGNVNTIRVGANHKTNGSVLALNLNVTGKLGSLNVFGQIAGSVTTGSDLGNLTVIGAGGNSDAITGNITIGGRLGVGNIINGNVASDISVEGSIGTFNITRGSLLSVGTVQSQIDGIRSFNIIGGTQYGLYGAVLAPSGLNINVNVSGNVGDGVDPAKISADSGNTFKIAGSVLANSMISTTFGLTLLSVTGNVASGATISAHPLKQIKVKGTNQGTITTD
jgi:hypothetical protein